MWCPLFCFACACCPQNCVFLNQIRMCVQQCPETATISSCHHTVCKKHTNKPIAVQLDRIYGQNSRFKCNWTKTSTFSEIAECIYRLENRGTSLRRNPHFTVKKRNTKPHFGECSDNINNPYIAWIWDSQLALPRNCPNRLEKPNPAYRLFIRENKNLIVYYVFLNVKLRRGLYWTVLVGLIIACLSVECGSAEVMGFASCGRNRTNLVSCGVSFDKYSMRFGCFDQVGLRLSYPPAPVLPLS